jgi:hypothetical protein
LHAVIGRVEGYTLSPSALFIDLSSSQKKTFEKLKQIKLEIEDENLLVFEEF